MAKRSSFKRNELFPVINPHAAGIDIGSKFHQVSIGEGISARFGVFTEDLHELANYLLAHGVNSVAMESTGFYWKNLFVLLQDYGLEVILVNARHTKNVSGKKTDKVDADWIRKLHSCGLLKASFQPDLFTEELRVYCRHRARLIEAGASYIHKMQKCLVLMNIQLTNVIADISGKSGMRIIEAIIEGERDPDKLAALGSTRLKASKEVLRKSLEGIWRPEVVFELKQCHELYLYHKDKITECDSQIEQLLTQQTQQHSAKEDNNGPSDPPAKMRNAKNYPNFDIIKLAHQLSGGIDLSLIPGVGPTTILTIISEVGCDLKSKFPSAAAFTSWLGLCPNNKVSGGRTLASRTQAKKNKLKEALKKAANAVERLKEQNALTHFFHRIKARKGRKVAVTVTARKIATTIYAMLTKQETFRPLEIEKYLQLVRKQKVNKVKRIIAQFEISTEEIQVALSA